MSTPVALAEPDNEGVPLTFDDDEPSGEIDFKSTAELQAEFEAGMVDESDFMGPARPPYPDDYEVPVIQDELPVQPEPPGPDVELLLHDQQAEALLDSLTAGEWRRWPPPPAIPCHGRGWSGVWYSEHELRSWVLSRLTLGKRRRVSPS